MSGGDRPPSEADEFKSLRGRAIEARHKGLHADAVDLLRQAAALRPDADLHREIGSAALDLRRLDDAEAAFQTALAMQPDFVDAQRGLGHVARAAGDRAAALDRFARAAEMAPSEPRCRCEIGTELVALNRSEEAEAAFEQALTLVPDFTPALLKLAWLAGRAGNHARALDLLRRVTGRPARDPTVRQDIAFHLFRLGRLEDAEVDYRAILDEVPGSFEARRGLGLVLRAAGSHGAALAAFADALAVRDDSGVRFEMASTRLTRGDPPSEAYRSLLEDPIHRTRALLRLSRHARSAGDPADEMRWLEQAYAADPLDLAVGLALAEAYQVRCQFDTAERLYESVLRRSPENVPALIGKASLCGKRGRAAEASALYELALELDATKAAPAFAQDLRRRGDTARARELLEGVRAMHPHDGTILVQLGLVARAAGDRPTAIRYFEESIARAPTYISAYVEAALEHQRAGRFAKARDVLEHGLALRADHPRVLEALGDLASIGEDSAEALAHYRRATLADPSLESPRLKLARALAAAGRHAEGLSALEASLSALGSSPDHHLTRGHIFKQAGWLTDAASAFRRGRQAFPHHFQLWLQGALLDIEVGDPDGLGEGVDFVPASLREQAKAKMVLGAKAAAQWRFDEAQAWLTQALDRNPDDAGILFRLAQAALLNLDLDTSERHLAHAARLEAPVKRLRGQATGPFQSLTGQILEEARLDPGAIGVLAAAFGRTAGRLQALLDVVTDHPNLTLAAMQVMIELRREGRLAAQPTIVGARPSIPDDIVQFWHTETVPPDVLELCQSWTRYNPEARYRRFSAQSATAFLADSCPAPVAAAFRRARSPAIKADIFRLAYLVQHGGYYADADDRCVAPLSDLRPGGAALLLYQEGIGSLGNNFIAATPGHPLLSRALEAAVEAVEHGDCDIAWLSTGPGLLTRVAAQSLADGGPDALDGVGLRVLERHDLQHCVATCLAAYKTTAAYWSRAAFRRSPATDRGTAARPDLFDTTRQREGLSI